MAISDKYLPGNLNRDEMDTIEGIPMSVFDKLSQEDKERILGLGNIREPIGNLNRTEMDTIKGIPKSIFNNLSPEEQSRVLGNLNRTEMDMLQGSEPEMGSFSEIRSMIRRLLSTGTPTGKILEIMRSIVPGQQHRLLKIIGEMMSAGASRNETLPGNLNRTEMEMLNNSAPVSRFNQGGIVSLRHLTRPLGI